MYKYHRGYLIYIRHMSHMYKCLGCWCYLAWFGYLMYYMWIVCVCVCYAELCVAYQYVRIFIMNFTVILWYIMFHILIAYPANPMFMLSYQSYLKQVAVALTLRFSKAKRIPSQPLFGYLLKGSLNAIHFGGINLHTNCMGEFWRISWMI